MLSLCLDEQKLDYFNKKNWVKQIVEAFNELGSQSKKDRVIDIISQLSSECLKYTLYQLFEAMTVPIVKLLKDDSERISGIALKALVNLCSRLDLQKNFCNAGAVFILIERYSKSTLLSQKFDIVVILSLMSVTNTDLLTRQEYTGFFYSKINRADIFPEENISEVESLELIEEINKISKLTAIAFPGEEVLSMMTNKIKFVYSQCRSPSIKIRSRALGTLSALALRQPLRWLLYETGMFNEIMYLLRDPENEVQLVACYVIYNILKSPDGLELWFKFDSGYVVDDSNTYILSGAIKNVGLGLDKGLYTG